MTDSRPLDTKHSAKWNHHVLSYDRTGNMVLAPGPGGRTAALVYVALIPLLLGLCFHFGLARGFWIAAVLFPLLAAGGFLAGHFGYAKLATRVVLNPRTRKIFVSGLRHRQLPEIPFDRVIAVQCIYAGFKGGPGRSWHAYQLNLVLADQSRYNLLDSGGVSQLGKIGSQMSKYLKVPFERYDKLDEQL
jgi:hypothetical protein